VKRELWINEQVRNVACSVELMRENPIICSHHRADRSTSVTVRSMCEGPVSGRPVVDDNQNAH
jgi:hypothetical protein